VLKNEQLDWLRKREKFKNNPDAFIALNQGGFVSYHSAIAIERLRFGVPVAKRFARHISKEAGKALLTLRGNE
jgi:hypothetical protein